MWLKKFQNVQPPFEIFLVPTWFRVPTWSGTNDATWLAQHQHRPGNEALVRDRATIRIEDWGKACHFHKEHNKQMFTGSEVDPEEMFEQAVLVLFGFENIIQDLNAALLSL